MSTRPYFRYSLAATAWTVGLPGLVLLVALVFVSPPPPAPVSAGIAAVAFLCASVIGAWRWRRFHASARLTFQELMIWAWVKRSWAERSLARGASLLGLDDSRLAPTTAATSLSAARRLRVLRRLNAALERKDPYTHGHSSRVETYCAEVGAMLGLDPDQILELRRAASLHDVGKMRVPDRILRKAGPLSPDERAVAEEHVVLGARLVARVGTPEVVGAVLHHHERWDGSGYPHGLEGERIPIYARIIAVVDAYDAMTSTRPYRKGVTSVRALQILHEEAGRQFDPEVVTAFVRTTEARSPVAVFAPLAIVLRRAAREARCWIRRPVTAGTAPAAGGMAAATLAATAILTFGPVTHVVNSSEGAGTIGSTVASGTASHEIKRGRRPSRPDVRMSQRSGGVARRGSAPAPTQVESDDAGSEPAVVIPDSTDTTPDDSAQPEDPVNPDEPDNPGDQDGQDNDDGDNDDGDGDDGDGDDGDDEDNDDEEDGDNDKEFCDAAGTMPDCDP